MFRSNYEEFPTKWATFLLKLEILFMFLCRQTQHDNCVVLTSICVIMQNRLKTPDKKPLAEVLYQNVKGSNIDLSDPD